MEILFPRECHWSNNKTVHVNGNACLSKCTTKLNTENEKFTRHVTTATTSFLINLYMPAVFLLQRLHKIRPRNTLAFCNRSQRLLHSTFHALQAAHVDVRLFILQQIPNVLSILSNPCLDVHLLPSRVLLLARDCIIVAEVFGVFGRVLFVLVVVK